MKAVDPGYGLIIDDNKDICDLLAHLLEQAGYQTRQGYDGVTALKLLSQREPDVLLLDSVIPEPNGMAVLAKAHARYPHLPVIIITGNSGILSAVCAIKAGAWDYLGSALDDEELPLRLDEQAGRAVVDRQLGERATLARTFHQLPPAERVGLAKAVDGLASVAHEE